MSEDTLYVAHDERAVHPEANIVELLRLSILEILDTCTAFAAEVEEAEADCGAMSIITIQQHLAYLREKSEMLGRRVQ